MNMFSVISFLFSELEGEGGEGGHFGVKNIAISWMMANYFFLPFFQQS